MIQVGVRLTLALQSQAISSPREVELTEEFVRSIEPLLANPATNRKLEIYDRLVFGKGRFLRIDGKNRNNAVLALDAHGKYFVRLFDLASIEDHEKPWKGLKYFTGVCSKAEVSSEGIVEITIIYATPFRLNWEKLFFGRIRICESSGAVGKKESAKDQSESTPCSFNDLNLLQLRKTPRLEHRIRPRHDQARLRQTMNLPKRRTQIFLPEIDQF